MYTATIKNVASAKNGAPSIYCQSKSGNIYKLKQQVPLQEHARLIAQIRAGKVINIQHWIKVKEGEYKPKPAKTKAPRPEYKEVVIKRQAARIKELQAQVKELKNELEARDKFIGDESSKFSVIHSGAETLAEARSLADEHAAEKRAAAAKKGWETRRRNAEDIEHASKMYEFEKSGDREGMLAYLEARTTPEQRAIEAQIAQQVAS